MHYLKLTTNVAEIGPLDVAAGGTLARCPRENANKRNKALSALQDETPQKEREASRLQWS